MEAGIHSEIGLDFIMFGSDLIRVKAVAAETAFDVVGPDCFCAGRAGLKLKIRG